MASARSIAISLGDPAGIGPEIIARAMAARPDLPLRVYGDVGVIERAAAACGLPAPDPARIVAVTARAPGEITPGLPSDAAAIAQVAYLAAATDAMLAGEAVALVTAPISKEWAARAGFAFPGHTEYLAWRAGAPVHAMMLCGPKLRVTVATGHIPLADVPGQLTATRVADCAVLTARALASDFGVSEPRVAIAGLNPHAGENGRIGTDERRCVDPAVRAAADRLARDGIRATVTGPHVPDVVFRQASAGGFDAVVALYHDQGLIPVKLLHFDEAVNLTLGLPFPRTSPDHGTAYDIAGRGVASPRSFLLALDLAVAMAARRAEP